MLPTRKLKWIITERKRASPEHAHKPVSNRLQASCSFYHTICSSLDLYWEPTYSSHRCQDRCLLGGQIGSLASKGRSLFFKRHLCPWRVSSQWLRPVFIDLASQGGSVFRKSPTEFPPISAGCQELKLVSSEHSTLELSVAGTLSSSSYSQKRRLSLVALSGLLAIPCLQPQQWHPSTANSQWSF